MKKNGPNPLSPYCFDTKEVPVETTESMTMKVLESTESGTEYDKGQSSAIKKNTKDIKSANEKIQNLENYDKDVYKKEEVDELLTLKADKSEIPSTDGFYTKDEVDAKIVEKEQEIFGLKKLIGDLGGAVTYDVPNDANISLNNLVTSYSGTIKLGEDIESGRIGPGITAKNTVKLNLNTHNFTCTNAGTYGAIMSRGTQNITIYGKGTIDAGNGICIEANGVDSVINLTGSTTVYHNNRSGAELVYCYAGTINITNGIFKNDGENKNFTLNCYDANYKTGKAKIVVTGGKFYGFNPADNNAEGEHTSFVAEGYTVVESEEDGITVYTVKKA